ncbi:hypothetical protein Tco_0369396 [Tanacetum coccineum]|uniref:Uncharacterized protein n=1 Tax=Tanacetum coccineum TaxID=301880 RepID=A0ABQ5HB00_9ASTR
MGLLQSKASITIFFGCQLCDADLELLKLPYIMAEAVATGMQYSEQINSTYRLMERQWPHPQGTKGRQIMTTQTPFPKNINVVTIAEKTDCHNKGWEFPLHPLLEEYYNQHTVKAEKTNNDQAPNASQEAEFIILFGNNGTRN